MIFTPIFALRVLSVAGTWTREELHMLFIGLTYTTHFALCPALESVEVSGELECNGDLWRAIESTVTSRRDARVPLKGVVLWKVKDDQVDEDAIARMHAALDEFSLDLIPNQVTDTDNTPNMSLESSFFLG